MSFSIGNKFATDLVNHVNSRLDKIKVGFEKNRYKAEFIKEELDLIEKEITTLYNSDVKLNTVFHKIQELLKADKDLQYQEAIKLCASENNVNRKSLYDFTLQLKSLYTIKEKIKEHFNISQKSNSVKREHLEITEKTDTEDQRNEQTLSPTTKDYTIARKVLTMSYLLNFIYESDVETFEPDKTNIARFIQSMVSMQDQSKNIINSNYYDKVRSLFGKPYDANVQDLIYVKEKFESIGMNLFVKQIDAELVKKKNKKQ
ncbi:MAG: hypothetical protein Q8891_17625 [Bacteroidota bacterium]|nr:hypothetical protein [Bacteroidota bacterium]